MEYYTHLLPFVLLIPLIGSVIHLSPVFHPESKLHQFIALITTILPLLLLAIIFIPYQFSPAFSGEITLWNWLTLGGISLKITLQLNHFTILMGGVVTLITFLVTLYSKDFMADQPQSRYYGALTLFLPAMLLLVFSENLLTLFVGWEGIGLASYLLIGYNQTSRSAELGARRTLQINRIGDLALLIAIFILMMQHHSLSFEEILPRATEPATTSTIWISLLIVIAAVAKSAQAPLFIWLPRAMAAPTPISALLHAATMVTAGIYLMIRFAPLINQVAEIKIAITIIGTITLFIAALIAIRQNNIKKILAYSTISQLGYIFVALGIGAYKAAFFHLITHAFFKALLFLGAASMIFASGGIKDIFQLSGRLNHPLMRTTRFTFLIGTIGITGTIPFIAGFLSKDAILWNLFISDLPSSLRITLWIFTLLTIALTALYMWRLYFILYPVHSSNHELPFTKYPSRSMNQVLWILAIFTLFSGLLQLPNFLLKTISPLHYIEYWLTSIPDPLTSHPLSHHIGAEMLLMFLGWFLAILVLFTTRWFYASKENLSLPKFILTPFIPFEKQLYLNQLVDRLTHHIHLFIYRWIWKTIEYFLIELIITRLAWGITLFGKLLSALQTGHPVLYFTISAGALLLLMITIIG